MVNGKSTVALWIKTYSLYLVALQPLTVSEPQATCVNVRPPKRRLLSLVSNYIRLEPGTTEPSLKWKCVCVWFESAAGRCVVKQQQQ